MKKYIDILKETKLFKDISDEEIEKILKFYNFQRKNYEGGTIILDGDANVGYAAIIIDGMVDVLHVDYMGNETIVNRFLAGQMVGESFASLKKENYISQIRTVSKTRLLLVNVQQLLAYPMHQSECYRVLIRNLMSSLAESNIALNEKIQLVSQKTLRGKIMAYFSMLSRQQGSKVIKLPFNREQMAAYLLAERSSLSRELSRLNGEGTIHIKGRRVILN